MMNAERHNIQHSSFLKGGISFLMYHQVGDFPPMNAHRASYCRYDRFRAQMNFLRIFRYHVLDMDTALTALQGKSEIPPRSVVLTFDDGCENFYEYAYPVLKKYGFPAIVYIVSGLVGKSAEWFLRDGRHAPQLMGKERIREICRANPPLFPLISFGAHGMTHIHLAKADEKRLREEIYNSKAMLEDISGEKVRHFCYPYGSYSKEVMEIAKEAGYVSAVTCSRGMACPGDDLLQIPRKAISYGDSILGFFWKLTMKNRRKTPPIISG
jgi:peptidoglycan/xylan/chitin deacetylase (PgdA/CDA1 family)